MKIKHTRAMIRAALSGALDHVAYDRDPRFNLDVPRDVSGCAGERADAASHMERSGAVRRAGREAGADVRRQLQAPSTRDVVRRCPGGRPPRMTFEAVIGLEIHAQLQTATKIFCGCSTAFGAPPNTNVCPVCLGFPGALPVLNRAAVDLAIRAGLALGCRINETSIFARKNYFYPDLPKGYQISQYEQPLASERRARVRRPAAPRARRASRACTWKRTPASRCTKASRIRIARPTSTTTAAACRSSRSSPSPTCDRRRTRPQFFGRLRAILVWLGVNDGNMEEGSLRCDANVSMRPAGTEALGTKAEVKNLNSFRFLQKALEYEIERQIEVAERGRPHPAGDAAVGRATRHHGLDAQQGRSARLSLFPRTRSAAGGRRRSARATTPRGDAGTSGCAPPPLRRRLRAAGIRRRPADAVPRARRLLRGGGRRRRRAEGARATG